MPKKTPPQPAHAEPLSTPPGPRSKPEPPGSPATGPEPATPAADDESSPPTV